MAEEPRPGEEWGDIPPDMPVARAIGPLEPAVAVLRADSDILAAALRVAERGARGVAAINAEGQLAGILPLSKLYELVLVHLIPEDLLRHMLDSEQMLSIPHELSADHLSDVMLPPVFVHVETRLRDALERMRDLGVGILAVVDAENRPVASLELLRVLRLVCQPRGAQARSGST